MHFAQGEIPGEYTRYIGRKSAFIGASLLFLAGAILVSIAQGAAGIPLEGVVRSLLGVGAEHRYGVIIWNIRLPQDLSAVAAGAGLAVSGAVMQSILRNPLGSPFTLGISQAAAFGAALAVMVLDAGVMASTQVGAVTISEPILTTATAFVFCLAAAAVIVAFLGIIGFVGLVCPHMVRRLIGGDHRFLLPATVILGPNGVGKTTLLRCINAILKPAEGAVWIDGHEVLGLAPQQIARRVGYVAQQQSAARLTAFDAILMGRRPHIQWRVSETVEAVYGVAVEIHRHNGNPLVIPKEVNLN